MGTYTRLGSSLLVSKLAGDPLGAVHRAVVIAGGSFERHVLVRTFSEELLQAGLDARLNEARRVAALLGGAKVFGPGYRIESGETLHALWDYLPGRSLAQLIDKAKQEQIPFGVELAFTVLQGLVPGIVQMQANGVSHGLINPHSVWVGFEGTIQLMDAPFALLVKDLLAEAPSAKRELVPYLQGSGNDAFQQDLFALGAVFYELLTFERLPLGADLQARLEQATLKAAQEEVPVPAEIRAFLGRLLLGLDPFTSVEAFNAELERLLYGGESSPSTFSMAFFMHTLFREENDREAAATRVEQSQDYLAFTAAGETLRSEIANAAQMEGLAETHASQNSATLIGAGLVTVVVLGLGYYFFGRHRVDPAILKQLEELKTLQAKFEQQKADLEARATAEGEKATQLQKQLTETRPAEEKAKIQKQIEEAQQRKLDLELQQKAAEQRLDEQRKKEQRLAEQKQAAESKPAEPPPVIEPPKPQPKPLPEPPKPAEAPVAAAPQPAPAPAPVYESARIVNQAAPIYPQRAIQMHWGTNQDQQVRLKVFVGEQGQVLKVSVSEGVAGTYGFDEAAIEAANKSTFSPATRDGKPVRGWTPEIVYRFLKRR